jgi:hypothetical protein
MKHLEPILETYVYNNCNMCNILIYFYNIDMKHLQHTSKTSETLETYACNMCFPAKYHLAAWTNGGSSLRSSTPVRRSVATHGAHQCPNGGTTLGEHLRKAMRAALGEHLCEEQLMGTTTFSTSTPRRAPSSRRAPLAWCAQVGQQLVSTPGSSEHGHHLPLPVALNG